MDWIGYFLFHKNDQRPEVCKLLLLMENTSRFHIKFDSDYISLRFVSLFSTSTSTSTSTSSIFYANTTFKWCHSFGAQWITNPTDGFLKFIFSIFLFFFFNVNINTIITFVASLLFHIFPFLLMSEWNMTCSLFTISDYKIHLSRVNFIDLFHLDVYHSPWFGYGMQTQSIDWCTEILPQIDYYCWVPGSSNDKMRWRIVSPIQKYSWINRFLINFHNSCWLNIDV